MEKFSLKLARAGAELVTRNGKKVEKFIKHPSNFYPYMYTVEGINNLVTEDGEFLIGEESPYDLFLAPFKGRLKGFPVEVVEWMVEQQVAQGNPADVRVFEDNKSTVKKDGGFTWNKTEEGHDFCYNVIHKKDFNLFFERYPKQPNKPEPVTPQVTPKLGDMVWVKGNNGSWSDKPRTFLLEKYGKYHCVALNGIDKFKDGSAYPVFQWDKISLTDPHKQTPTEPQKKPELKPFDKVLVRDDDDQVWG